MLQVKEPENFRDIELKKDDIFEKWTIIYFNSNTNIPQTAIDIGNDIKLFNCIDNCIDFLSNSRHEKVCLILREYHIDFLVPLIHDIPQLKFIYIHYENETNKELNMNQWTKIKGSFINMTDFWYQFKQNIRKSEYDLASINFAYSLTNSNQKVLDASFMYSQLLKDILLNKNYDDTARKDFINYLRTQDANEPARLKDLNEFERNHPPRSSIWWYTKAPLFYERVNKALRTQDTDTLVHMGMYIQELHHEIETLHAEQKFKEKLIVYRGQLMYKNDFEKLEKNQGGLLSFNNFLSTSKEKDVSFIYADSSSLPKDLVGISFRIEIDPTISSIPFAIVRNTSQHEDEEEILFSMHTIFHIEKIIQITENSWQINLTLTDDNDTTLKQVTEYMRQQIRIGTIDKSLVYLLIRMGKYKDAENICDDILQSTSIDLHTRLEFCRMLGAIKHHQGDHNAALSCFQTILDIFPLSARYDYINLVDVYSNIAAVHESLGNYPTACELCEIVAEIREKSLSNNAFDLGLLYNNIAVMKNSMGHHRVALKYFQKSLDIFQSILPSAHPELAYLYNNIGVINNTIGEREIAHQYFEKAHQIQKRSLLSNHLDIIGTLNNLAITNQWIGHYEMAIDYYQESLKILKENNSSEYANLGLIHNNIAQLYKILGKYTEAIEYHLKAIDIEEKISSTSNLRLPGFYINIALTYNLMANFSKAHYFLKKAYDIQKQYLSPDHREWARIYNSIGMVYQGEEKYDKANCFYKKAIDIQEKVLPSTHPDLACLYNNLAYTEFRLNNGYIAFDYLERTLRIQEQHLPSMHPDIARTYSNMGSISLAMGKRFDAQLYMRKAVEIQQRKLSPTHPELGKTYLNLGVLHCLEQDYCSGLEYFQKARRIFSVSLPSDHPDLAKIDDTILKAQSCMSSWMH